VLNVRSCILGLGLGSLFLGCASVPLADVSDDARAKQFVVSESTVTMYLVRDGAFGFDFNSTIFRVAVDGREVGVLAPWTYLVLEVPPGAHVITATTPENQDRLTVEAELGRLAFVRVEHRTGWMAGRASLSVLTEPTGRDLVRRSSLVRP